MFYSEDQAIYIKRLPSFNILFVILCNQNLTTLYSDHSNDDGANSLDRFTEISQNMLTGDAYPLRSPGTVLIWIRIGNYFILNFFFFN